MLAEGEGKGGVEGGGPRLCHKPFAPMGLCTPSFFVGPGRGVGLKALAMAGVAAAPWVTLSILACAGGALSPLTPVHMPSTSLT